MKRTIYILKIKLKSVLKPIVIEIENKDIVDKLFDDLQNDRDFITIGNQLAFSKQEMKYTTVFFKEVN